MQLGAGSGGMVATAKGIFQQEGVAGKKAEEAGWMDGLSRLLGILTD